MASTTLSVLKLEPRRAQLEDYLADADRCEVVPVGPDVDARGYFAFAQPSLTPAPWSNAVRVAFPGIPRLDTQSARGVGVFDCSGNHYAVTFGPAARFLLDPAAHVVGWGRRIALNLLYDSNGVLISKGGRLRKERTAQLSRGTTTVVQSSKEVNIEVLGFNSTQDVLRGVTIAVERNDWARYAEGTDAFRLKWNRPLSSLPALFAELEALATQAHYREHFSFVDDLRVVSVKSEIEEVYAAAAMEILAGNSSLGLVPPESTDFVELNTSVLGVRGHPVRGGLPLSDLSVGSYLSVLAAHGAASSLSGKDLCNHRLRGEAEGVDRIERPVANWLEGPITCAEKTYCLSEGTVYCVSTGFLADLDAFVDAIPAGAAARLGLPALSTVTPQPRTKNGKTTLERDENAFNVQAATPADRLCMDGENVITIKSRTTAIEFCDVLTSQCDLVHAKRGTASATLSHLFAQAAVSAELLLDSVDFQAAAWEKVKGVARASSVSPAAFRPCVPQVAMNGAGFTIVLAIISKQWAGPTPPGQRACSEVLPFFSKINLRLAVTRLKERSFAVEVAKILD